MLVSRRFILFILHSSHSSQSIYAILWANSKKYPILSRRVLYPEQQTRLSCEIEENAPEMVLVHLAIWVLSLLAVYSSLWWAIPIGLLLGNSMGNAMRNRDYDLRQEKNSSIIYIEFTSPTGLSQPWNGNRSRILFILLEMPRKGSLFFFPDILKCLGLESGGRTEMT